MKKADLLSESGNKTSKHGRTVPQISDLVTFSALLVRGKISPKTPVENGRFEKNQQRENKQNERNKAMKKMKDTREKMYRFRANEEESELIEKKYMLSSCQSMSDFFRQMILYGMVVKYDEKQLDRISDLIEKISLNFNQIAVRINSTNRSYAEDIAQMKQEMKEIWQLQKSIQLQLQKLKP